MKVSQSRTGKLVMVLAMVLLLGLTVACAPAPQASTQAPTPASAAEKVAPTQEVAPPSAPEPTPAVERGMIEIRVTDPPPAGVKSAVVYLANIEVHKVSGNTSEWITIIGAPPSFDLMAVIGVEAVLGSANITAGSFTQIRLDVTRVTGVTTDNVSYTAEVPGDKLRIVGAFDVGAGTKTILTLDFDGEKSLVRTGQGKFLFKPVVRLLISKGGETGKSGEAGKPSGTGKPDETGKPTETGEGKGKSGEGKQP